MRLRRPGDHGCLSQGSDPTALRRLPRKGDIVNWLDYLLVSWFALGTLLTIHLIGKPRKSITSGDATAVTAINAALIVLVVLFR